MKRASLSIAILLLMVLSSSVINAQDNATEEVKPLSPEQALASFELPDDLQLNIAVAEPDISQPVFFNFDERGRLWVMNYLQYPYPAGLKMVSRDQYWRAVYDKVPMHRRTTIAAWIEFQSTPMLMATVDLKPPKAFSRG